MRLVSIVSIMAAAMLAGCATSGSAQRVGPDGTGSHLDQAKMAHVERVALARGVKVIWVNPPEAKQD